MLIVMNQAKAKAEIEEKARLAREKEEKEMLAKAGKQRYEEEMKAWKEVKQVGWMMNGWMDFVVWMCDVGDCRVVYGCCMLPASCQPTHISYCRFVLLTFVPVLHVIH